MTRAFAWLSLLCLCLAAGSCRRGSRADSDIAPAHDAGAVHAELPPPAAASASLLEPPRSSITAAPAPAPDVGAVFRTRAAPIAESVKIFLFAGSSMNANFAQEVIDQKRLWHDAGFGDDEIACYYVIPYQEELDADREQYLALAPALADCYPASVKLLREHLAATARGPFVYLYMSAHGQQPISRRLAEVSAGDDGYEGLRRQAGYPVFDQYHVMVEALPDGTASGGELLGALRAGMDGRDIYLTPAHLAGFLSQSYARTPKYVVLQACYSGGFIRDATGQLSELAQLHDITILTAARHDRESFGCGSDDTHTYYGGVFTDVLAHSLASPLRLDWRALSDTVSARVAELESELPVRASLPVFYSNHSP